MLREYTRKDFKRLVDLSEASFRTPGWAKLRPPKWDESYVAREFLVDPTTHELIRDPEVDAFMRLSQEEEVTGVIIAQSLDSFLKGVPEPVRIEVRKLVPEGEGYYQRHIVFLPDAKSKTDLVRLFKAMEEYATDKKYQQLVVGVPIGNEKGNELMKILRYGNPFFSDGNQSPDTSLYVPLNFYKQKLN